MNALQQLFHIFRKDVRALRWEIAGALALNLAFIIVVGHEAKQKNSNDGDTRVLLMTLYWWFLIARLIQSEPLPGDRQFWLTRPYRRVSLFGSKLLFIITFVVLPLAVSQCAILLYTGLTVPVGALLLNLARITGLYLIPIIFLAAITRNLAQFFLSGFVSLASVVALFGLSNVAYLGLGRRIIAPWIPVLSASALFAGLGFAILALQYWRRRSLPHTVLFFCAAAVIVLWTPIFNGDAYGTGYGKHTLKNLQNSRGTVAVGPPLESQAATHSSAFPRHILLPISIVGITDPGATIHTAWLQFEAPIARDAETGVAVLSESGRQFLYAGINPAMYKQLIKTPRASQQLHYEILFSTNSEVDLPQDHTPVMVPGIGLCNVSAVQMRTNGEPSPSVDVLCRTAFQSNFENGELSNDTLVLFLPERSLDMTINPIAVSKITFLASQLNRPGSASSVGNFHLITRDVHAIYVGSVDITNVHLLDYAIPE